MAEKSSNRNLSQAKKAKNDEFYTQFYEIEKEINAYLEYNSDVFRNKTVFCPCDDPEWSNFTIFFAQNFENFGLKKLICTSFAPDSNQYNINYQPTLFETKSPHFDKNKTRINGKLFILDTDNNKDGKINFNDLEWEYLKGDGDFRSNEVKPFRDEADFIITNPPFSLFREFLAWIFEAKKQFAIIGNMNAIIYKEVFPLIKDNKMWCGATGFSSDMVFAVPKGAEVKQSDKEKAEKLGYIGDYTRLGNSCWYSNIEHGRRHEPLPLISMSDNKKFNKKIKQSETAYQEYENYKAIEVPFTNAIPSDYEGVMGVPISFLDKFSPEQFEIIGMGEDNGMGYSGGIWNGGSKSCLVKGKAMFKRIFIKHKPQ